MVMSFQGERKKKEKQLSAKSTKVEDYMTKSLVTFKPGQLLHEVVVELLRHNISGGPVLDESGHLIGVISEGDCLKELSDGKYHNLPTFSNKVETCMTTKVVGIGSELSVFEAAEKFLELKIRRFPVLKDNKLVGQISQRDIMKALVNIKSATWGENA